MKREDFCYHVELDHVPVLYSIDERIAIDYAIGLKFENRAADVRGFNNDEKHFQVDFMDCVADKLNKKAQ